MPLCLILEEVPFRSGLLGEPSVWVPYMGAWVPLGG